MRQDPGWTLADNSLSMELYYKDHLHLIETWNINFSKLIIETLQDVSQSSSSYLPQSSWIRSPPPPSLPRSNLLLVQTHSQSSSSQSLSAIATPFQPKWQFFLLISPTAPPKLQACITNASPPFREDFYSAFKTTSDHMPSAKPTNLITSLTSASSSSEIPQTSQLTFLPPSSIPLTLLSTVTSPCTPTFSYSPTPQLIPHFLLLHLHLPIISYLIPHQKYYLQIQVLLYMLRSTLLKKCKYHLLSYLT